MDERERKRASRARRAAAAGCHAPPSAAKYLIPKAEIEAFVDRALGPSRATLVRDLRGILQGSGCDPGEGWRLSRATLGP